MAKAKKQPADNPKKHRRGLAANRRRRRARAVTQPRERARANPPIGADLTHVLLPGFLAYAGTRVLQRIVYSIVQKRWPKFGKHAHAATGLLTFGATWFGAHRIKRIAPYHDGVLVGTGIAAAHGLAQTYLPAKYNWLLADCKPSDVAALPKPENTGFGSGVQPAAGDEYSYLEDFLEEPAGQARTYRPPKAVKTPVANAMNAAASAQAGVTLDPDLMNELELGEDVDDLYSGAFEN